MLTNLNEQLTVSDSTLSNLEESLSQVRNESARLHGLMEQSLAMTQNLQTSGAVADVKSLEREMWELERECRLLSTPVKGVSRPSTLSPRTSELHHELISTKEQLAELKRQVEQFTQSPGSPTFPTRSRESTAEHHHHHYYYHVPEFARPLSYASQIKAEDTPIHSRFFRELPTPPLTASSISTSVRHERFSSSLSGYPLADLHTPIDEVPPVLERTYSEESMTPYLQTDLYTKQFATTPLKRSSSHES